MKFACESTRAYLSKLTLFCGRASAGIYSNEIRVHTRKVNYYTYIIRQYVPIYIIYGWNSRRYVRTTSRNTFVFCFVFTIIFTQNVRKTTTYPNNVTVRQYRFVKNVQTVKKFEILFLNCMKQLDLN